MIFDSIERFEVLDPATFALVHGALTDASVWRDVVVTEALLNAASGTQH